MKNFLLLVVLYVLWARANAQSLTFNGSSSYVYLGKSQSFGLTAFTLEAWIKITGAGQPAGTGKGGIIAVPIIAKGRGEADAPASLNMNYLLGVDPTNRLSADFEESSGRNHPITSKAALPANTWTHVAVSYEPVTAVWKLYINGVQDTAQDIGSQVYPASTSSQPASIATALNSQNVPEGYFNGRIDEVRIWNVTRTAGNIRDNYKLQLASGTGLVARYPFNENSGTIATNTISTYTNGTLVNNPGWVNGFNNGAPAVSSNPAPANGSNIAGSAATLQVTPTDPNNDRLKLRFYGRKKLTKEKFTIILIPDTQFYTAEPQGKNGGSNMLFKKQTDWIANNRATRNIVYVGHLGDCVENGDQYEVEWKRADSAIKTMESPGSTGLLNGLPYGVCVGNHDQTPFGDPKGSTTLYNKYFGAARFGNRPYYGGHAGTNNDNHYQVFSAGGIDFLVICPEHDQTSPFSAAGGTLDWMESLARTHPAHKVIVLSHHVLTIYGSFTPRAMPFIRG